MNQNLFNKSKRTPKQFAKRLLRKGQQNKREQNQPVTLRLEILFIREFNLGTKLKNQIIETWNVTNYGKFN